ncbi:WD40/YVTN/BNR-like repeat-containing protein [Piscinibacter sakaiensis]|uniref:WD40/YVTN/BNR-like repeat-containing protein n=1 Tax=Piscinibacter sakaiensis TaxID=1547922 RepID=UPI003AABBBEC
MEHLVALAVAVAALAAPTAATAAPVGDALDRPAVQAAHPERAVLQAAAQAGQRIVAVGERGIVLLSDDGAAKWRQVPVPTSVTLTAVRFVDDKHGWAVGHGGVILASTDGGASWTRQLDGKTAADLMLKAAQASGDPAAVKEAEWLVSAGADKPFLDLHFFDARHGIVVGAYNLAFETRDGGQTWNAIAQRLDNPRGLHLYAVRTRGDKVLIVGEQGVVRLSTDGGQTFQKLDTGYPGSFFSAEWLDDKGMLLAGLRGQLWRSNDLGASWTQVPSPAPASFTASARGPDQSLWLSNQAGRIFAWRDGSLQALPGEPLPPIGGMLPLPDKRLLALTLRGAVVVPLNGAPK